MGAFRFKEFEVRNELSAMKVNTDSVLLGALCTVKKEDRRVLDISARQCLVFRRLYNRNRHR